MSEKVSMNQYLKPTEFINSDHVKVITFVMISFLIYLRTKIKSPVKNDTKQSKEINFTS